MEDLKVLAVDDERAVLDDLEFMLRRSQSVGEVLTAVTGSDALRLLNEEDDVDALLVDIQMPGLNGLDLVRTLRNFKNPPLVAFVTAHDEHALEAFELEVIDYLLKPVDEERLTEALRRICERKQGIADPGAGEAVQRVRIQCRVGDRTYFIERRDVMVAEATGDYVRLHTDDGSHLIRQTLSELARQWAGAGFVRTHRGYLVRATGIRELISTDGKTTATVGHRAVPVSRRYLRPLRAELAAL